MNAKKVIQEILGESSHLAKKDVVMDILSHAGGYDPIGRDTLDKAISLFGLDSELLTLIKEYNGLVKRGHIRERNPDPQMDVALTGDYLDDEEEVDHDYLAVRIEDAAMDIFLWAAKRGIRPDFTPLWDEDREIEDIEAEYERNKGNLPL